MFNFQGSAALEVCCLGSKRHCEPSNATTSRKYSSPKTRHVHTKKPGESTSPGSLNLLNFAYDIIKKAGAHFVLNPVLPGLKKYPIFNKECFKPTRKPQSHGYSPSILHGGAANFVPPILPPEGEDWAWRNRLCGNGTFPTGLPCIPKP